jgi:hypothetical protein
VPFLPGAQVLCGFWWRPQFFAILCGKTMITRFYGGFKDAFTVSFFAFFVVLVFTIPIFDPWPYDNITYRGQSSLTVDPYVSVHQNGWDNGDPKRI